MKQKLFLTAVFGIVILYAVCGLGATEGDINGSKKIDLRDVIVSLQSCAGMTPLSKIYTDADVNEDSRIGLAEVVFAIQVVAKIRPVAWYKDADGDGYSDGTVQTSTDKPAGSYYLESELKTVSGDSNDNNADIHPSESESVQAAVQTGGSEWAASSNPIAEMPDAERRKLLGSLIPEETEIRANGRSFSRAARQLPSAFDWRNAGGNFVTSVKDQGQCGSCWAFATTAMIESEVLIHSYQSGLDLSEQIVLSCSGAGSCNGGYLSSALNFLRDTGTAAETCYPYTVTNGNCSSACANWQTSAFKIDDWSYVSPVSVSAIKNAVYTTGPVGAVFYVYTDFYYYKSGVYSYTWGVQEGGHGVMITGWDDSAGAFIVKNSWDTDWGESGYFRIAYAELEGNTRFGTWSYVCNISDQPPGAPPNADAGQDKSVEEGISLTLDGSASSDPDNDIVSYEWTQAGGTNVTLSNAETAQASFTAPDVTLSEKLTFRLTVTDSGGLQDTDDVVITVTDKDMPPDDTCILLQNETITATEAYETADCIKAGSAVDPDKTQGKYVVESGADVTMDAGVIYLEPGFEAKEGSEFRATAK